MSRILVTGANGFAGKHITARLSAAGHEVHAIVRPPYPDDAGDNVVPHVADLTDLPALRRIVAATKPDKAIHLAAIAFAAYSDIDEIYRTNVVGSHNFFEALATEGNAGLPTLVMSSANVYGNSSAGRLDEDQPFDPVNDYAVSKVGMEFVTRLFGDRLSFIITRPFNYTGVGQNEAFIIPKIVAHARRRAAYIELGNLEVARDFSDVRFVAEVCLRLLSTPAAIGETVNICSGRPYSLREVLAKVAVLADHEMEVRVNPRFVRANEIDQLWGSRDKLDRLVGDVPMPALDETLAWMLGA